MKFTINTAKLNSMLSKVQRGVGNSKILPVTEYIEIMLGEGILAITATDLANFITCMDKGIENGEEGKIVVKAEQLIKLVAKTTVSNMTFVSGDNFVEVTGNGKYKIPLFETNEYPEYEFNCEDDYIKVEMDTSVLKKLFAVNRSAIATEMLMPCLTGYNVGDKAVTTDGIKMCINAVTVFPDRGMLITQTLADLIQSLTSEKVMVEKSENKLMFTTDNLIIFGTELDGIDQYPDITPILDVIYSNMVVMSKVELMNAIDRLSLFVDQFDNNGIRMVIGKGELVVQDLKKNSTETIKLEQHVSADDGGEIVVNINYLKDVLGALSEANVHLEYGNGLPVKIVENNITLILSTMTEGA